MSLFSFTDRTRVDLGSISNSRGSGGSNSRGSHDLGSRNESNNKIYPLAYNDNKTIIDINTTPAINTTDNTTTTAIQILSTVASGYEEKKTSIDDDTNNNNNKNDNDNTNEKVCL